MASMADFLKDLPTRNRENFTRLQPGTDGTPRQASGAAQARPGASAVARHRAAIYVPTKDYPPEQVRDIL